MIASKDFDLTPDSWISNAAWAFRSPSIRPATRHKRHCATLREGNVARKRRFHETLRGRSRIDFPIRWHVTSAPRPSYHAAEWRTEYRRRDRPAARILRRPEETALDAHARAHRGPEAADRDCGDPPCDQQLADRCAAGVRDDS